MPQQGSFSRAEYGAKKQQTRRDKACPGAGRGFWPRWKRWCHGRGWRSASLRFIRKANAVGRRSGWSGCCGSISCSSGTGWPAKRSRRRSEPALGLDPRDSQARRRFAGIELNRDPVPDATTVLHLRHWLERHDLAKGLFDEVSAMLEERGLLMRQGTIVDAVLAKAGITPRRPQPRTKRRAATRRCIRPGRATNGTLA